ncbi:MAG: Cna B-type domain-containing protein [Oscillospiraceae bacterium]|nr:Cna B-type domain-containing protein [Oscillospiraceae bacterium]
MAKKLLCVLLSVLMVVTMLPTGVFADTSNFDYIYVAGVNILEAENYTVACGDGIAVYDPDTDTITLTNATITAAIATGSYYYGIYAYASTAPDNGLTIKLVGDNTIVTAGGGSREYGIYVSNTGLNITSESGGTLTMSGSFYYGIYNKTLSISDCTISLSGVTNSAIYISSGTINIDNLTLTIANNGGYGIRGTQTAVSISNSAIDISGTTNYCMYASGTNTATIADSVVTCINNSTSNAAIYFYKLNVSGNSTVVAANCGLRLTGGDLVLDSSSSVIYVGSSADDATEYASYTEKTTITADDIGYKTYAYLAITTEEPTEVSASVTWSDTESHDAVTLTLNNGTEDVATVELSDDNSWAGEFSAVLDDTLTYTVTATEVEGYTYEVTGDTTEGFVVTYTADEEEESNELRGIYGGYGSSYNQETDSYSILCTDDLTSSQKEATVGTTSVKFYFDGNSDFASNLQYQVAYGTVYLWNFLDGLVSTGQYADGNTLAMTGNSVSYPLSITSVDDAYSITAGTGWTYDADNPVWIITKIEFLDSSGNVLLTLTEFSSEDEEDETDYTFPIEDVEFATSGWSTTYDSTTGVATFGSWTGLDWWFGSSSTLELSELTITATSDIDWQVVVEYVDGTTSTTVSASDGTCTVTPEATAISQIYVQSKAAGDIAFTSVTYTLAEEDSGDETTTLVEDVDISTSGWSYTYDATTGTITFSEAWAGCGWWFGSSSELILSEFAVTTGNEMTYQVVVEYVDGTSSTTVVSSSDGTCTVTPEATTIKQIYIQGYAAGDLTVTGVTYTIAEEDNGTEYLLAFDVMETTNWGGDWWISGTEVNGYSDGSSSVTVTLTDISGLTGSTYLVENASEILLTNSGADLEDVVVVFSGTVNGETVTYTYTVGDAASGENTIVVNPVSSDLYTLLTTGTDVTATITFTVSTGSSGSGSGSGSSALVTDSARFIYVNDTYHAIVLNGHFITIAHSDSNGDGYCDGCYYYMGTDDEEDDSDLVSEEVTVSEPVEDTDTPDEEEDEEDLDVGNTDSSDEETETNPTTGVALALIPMAIAGFAVVSSKRR